MNLTSIENLLNSVDDFFYTYLLTALLILAGIYLTARSRLVQLRHFGTMVNSLSGSRSGAQGGISSFQAFAVGLAARVGIGNIAGVALAVVAGGPGALFWMWVVALIWLARWGVGALRDWDAQRAAGRVAPLFSGVGNPYLPGDLPGDVGTGERASLAEADGTAADVPAATPASSQPAASTGADA